MKKDKLGCSSCSRIAQDYVPNELHSSPELIIYGEAPGKDELVQGRPFIGRSGQLLRSLLPTQHVSFKNTCQCGTSKPNIRDIRACDARSEIKQDLSTGLPVILCGEYALKAWFNRADINVTDNRGYIQPGLYATYHPAAALRDSKYEYWIREDLRNVGRRKTRLGTKNIQVVREGDFPRLEGRIVSFDIETTGLTRGKDRFTVGCVYSPGGQEAHRVYTFTDLECLRAVFRNRISGCTILGHNLKFDLVMSELGLDYRDLSMTYEDTLVLLRIVKSGLPNYELVRLAEDFLDYGKWWMYAGAKDKFRDQAENCAKDVVATYELWKKFRPEAEKYRKPYEISSSTIRLFADTEKEGIPIDTGALQQLCSEHKQRLGDAGAGVLQQILKDRKLTDVKQKITDNLNKEQVKKLSGKGVGLYLNLNSPNQLKTLLYEVYRIPLRGKGYQIEEKTDELTLLHLRKKYPIAQRILDHNESATDYGLLCSIRDRFLVNGHIYPQHKAEGAATGRTSASRPNTQQLKKKFLVRLIRLEPDEFLVGIDWSQIELRVLAYIAQDPVMLQAYRENRDLHQDTVNAVYRNFGVRVSRREAKITNFGIVYGISEYGLQKRLYEQGVNRTVDECRILLDSKKAEWPGVARYMYESGLDTEKAVSPIGRVRILTEGGRRAYNQKLNHPVQSLANDISLTAFYWLWKMLDPTKARLITFRHDEVLVILKKDYLMRFYGLYLNTFSNWIMEKVMDKPFNVPIHGDFSIYRGGISA